MWNPPKKFEWQYEKPEPLEVTNQSLRIYEAHVGMAQEDGKVSSYREFADCNLQRIVDFGYNAVQLMAIQEHAYYASFGYHVTNFFAVSSRFGTPDDFKYLVDKAHRFGLRVIVDCVHSHASTNVNDGINMFDGPNNCYFLPGEQGRHAVWDSMLFNYSQYEVKRFLLANLAWFLEEYKVDGFRFDAVTSILYKHHGINHHFSGDYSEYFGQQTDLEGITYLMLANELIRKIRPDAITIAEDVSGMPAVCRSIREGGLGFDYRLGMGAPDMWVQFLKDRKDTEWSVGEMVHMLTNNRKNEKVVCYAESHDQAIVGDKTISCRLFGDNSAADMTTGNLTSKI